MTFLLAQLLLLVTLCSLPTRVRSQCLVGGSTQFLPDGRRVLEVFTSYDLSSTEGTELSRVSTLAFEEINSSPLLPGYFLNFTITDEECAASPALQNEIEFYNAKLNSVVGVIGGYCSVASEPLALLNNVYQVPQISFSSTSPSLSDKIKYPYFMRVVSSDANQAQAWLAAAKHFGWKRVATLNSQESLHALLTGIFLESAVAAGIEVVSTQSFPGSQGADMSTQLQTIADQGATIIFLACYDYDARTVFRLKPNITNLEGKNILFVGTDAWVNTNFIDPNYSPYPELEASRLNIQYLSSIIDEAEGSIGFTFATGDNAKNVEVKNLFEDTYGISPKSAYFDFAYDAVFALAYGIRDIVAAGVVPPDPITDEWRGLLSEHILTETSFEGISKGQVKFDVNGDGYVTYLCLNMRGTNFTSVAYWDPVSDIWDEIEPPIWPDGTTVVPSDSPPHEVIYLSDGLRWAFIALAIIAFILPIINFILLALFWAEEHIVASTPPFLASILFGTMLSTCSIFVIAVDPTDATCIIPHWFNHMAFWIIFSCLFVKTARVYYIFLSLESKIRKVKPIAFEIVLLAVLVMCTLAALYLALWTGLDAPHAVLTPDKLDPERILILECDYNVSWAGALYAVELAFLSVGVFLAYQINKIKVLRTNMLKYNESSHIAVCIYALIFVGLVIIPNITWLSESNDTRYILECVGILVISVTINIVLFLPKWLAIAAGKKHSSTTPTAMNSGSTK